MSKGGPARSPEESANNRRDLPPPLDRLGARLVPFSLRFFDELGSTNDAAVQLLSERALQPPAAVVAGHQTAGRGQRGKGWFSSPASLAASFVVSAGMRPAHQLPLLVGLTVREVLAAVIECMESPAAATSSPLDPLELAGGVRIKWPNDLLINGRKVAGILCERRQGADIIGIGVNIRHEPGEIPAELRSVSVALADIAPAPDRWELLASLAQAMQRRVCDMPHDESWTWVLQQWPAYDALLGREVEVSMPQGSVSGTAHGIDQDGQLRLVTGAGESVIIASGTVRLKPSPGWQLLTS